MSERLSRREAARLLKINEEELARLCREHLEYRVDYFMHRKDGTQLTANAVGMLKDIVLAPNHFESPPDVPRNALYRVKPGEAIRAKVANTLPPNKRHAWVIVPGFEGKQICNIPPRYARLYRIPKKPITVRHVEGNVFQLAIVNFRDEEANDE